MVVVGAAGAVVAGAADWKDGEPESVVLAWEPEQTRLRGHGVHLPPFTAAVVRMGQSTARS